MSRQAWITTAVLWIAGALTIAQPADSAPAGGKPAIAVIVESAFEDQRPPGPITFGMIFARGDMPDAVAVEGLPTQADVKRRWPDGSIKHAILTVDLPELPAGAQRVLRLVRTAKAEGRKAALPSATDVPGWPQWSRTVIGLRRATCRTTSASSSTARKSTRASRRAGGNMPRATRPISVTREEPAGSSDSGSGRRREKP